MTIDEIQIGKWYTIVRYGQDSKDSSELNYIKGRCVGIKGKDVSLKFFANTGYPWRTTQVVHVTTILSETGRPGFMSNY